MVTAFGADGSGITHAKRHLVAGLEIPYFTPGVRPVILPQGIALVICKDMDFQATIRKDTATN